MQNIRLALVGYGNVAQGLTQILQEEGEIIAQQFGTRFQICSIADPIKGCAFDEKGLAPAELLTSIERNGSLHGMKGSNLEWSAVEMIQRSPVDVVVEMSYTNLQTGEPSTTYMIEALRRKKHVITTNKGPIALHFDRLAEIALQNGVKIGVEGTVMSGTPAIRVGRELLWPARIQRIQGIFNGTTNYILTQMEDGQSYQDSLAEAQAKGYAEADPRGDVEGFDAAAKVAILARLVLGQAVRFDEVKCTGITSLTTADISNAKDSGRHWKLVGTLDTSDGKITAKVQPECLEENHPLAGIKGVTNAIVYSTDLLGDVTLIGPGAGRLQTGYAIIQDLLSIYTST